MEVGMKQWLLVSGALLLLGGGLRAQQVLSEPIDGRLFFAGEATSIGHIGTVHGAIQSGRRAAQEVLEK